MRKLGGEWLIEGEEGEEEAKLQAGKKIRRKEKLNFQLCYQISLSFFSCYLFVLFICLTYHF